MKYLILLILVGCGARVTEHEGTWTCNWQPSFFSQTRYEFKGKKAQTNAHQVCNKLSKGKHILPPNLEEKEKSDYYYQETK